MKITSNSKQNRQKIKKSLKTKNFSFKRIGRKYRLKCRYKFVLSKNNGHAQTMHKISFVAPLNVKIMLYLKNCPSPILKFCKKVDETFL